MYKTVEENKYYIFDRVNNKIKVCKDNNELLIYLRQLYRNLTNLTITTKDGRLYSDWGRDKVISRIDLSGNDIDEFGNAKRFIVYDEYDRIVDIRDIAKYAKETAHVGANRYGWNRNWTPFPSHLYKFRQAPVPHTGWTWGNYYRRPRYVPTMRQNSIPEYKAFVRPKAALRNETFWWDDHVRCIQRSWKVQSKKKRQWMSSTKDNKLYKNTKIGFDDDLAA